MCPIQSYVNSGHLAPLSLISNVWGDIFETAYGHLFPNIFLPGGWSIFGALTLDQNSHEVPLQVNTLTLHLGRHQCLLLPPSEKLFGKHTDCYPGDFIQHWLKIALAGVDV